MEQKTVLAIVLSVIILFAYQSIFVVPKKQVLPTENKIAAPVTPASAEKPLPEGKEKSTAAAFKEEKWESSSTFIPSTFTNMGGSLLFNQKGGWLLNLLSIKGLEEAPFALISHDNNTYTFGFQDNNWSVRKSYTILGSHTISVRMEIKSNEISRLENIGINLFTLDVSNEDPHNARSSMFNEYSVLTDKKLIRRGNANRFAPKDNKIEPGPIQWMGFRDQYDAVIVKPEFETKAYEVNELTEKKISLGVQPKILPPSGVYEFKIYDGPQDVFLMKKEGNGFEKIVAFSNFWLFNWIAKGIYFLIPIVHSIVRSWGLTIIAIALLVYALAYPLTIQSMLSMRRMQQVQPKLKALQERYKNDPQKLNAEMMEIYKREKINPLGGCLPFLLQMPIFIGLYQALQRSFYFQGKGFLWAHDLSQPDRLFTLSFSLPFLGNEINLFPILMGIVMFAQQKISSKNMVVSDEQQAMQQKMMMYFFPFFIAFIFYKFASGLSLYFTVFYLLSTFTQWKMSKIK